MQTNAYHIYLKQKKKIAVAQKTEAI